MDCLACGTPGTKVKDSQDDGVEVKRKRTCPCGAVFFSAEAAIKKTLRVPISRHGGELNGTSEKQTAPIDTGGHSFPPPSSRGGGGDPSSDPISSPSSPSSPSSSLPNPDPPKQPDQLSDPARWTPGDWKNRFGLAWANALHRGARHYAERGDGKACGDLGDLLDSLPETDVLEAQVRASEMFAEYLAGRAPAVVQAGHCFAFFVTRWGALRIPEADRPKADGKPNGHADPRIGHARAEVKTRPTGEVDL